MLQDVDKLSSLDSEERLNQAKILKDKGAGYFKSEKFKAAIQVYKRLKDLIEDIDDDDNNHKEEFQTLLLSSYLNLSLCYLKINENIEAKNACDSALELDPNNEKGLFRRGQANLALASPEIAIQDFQRVLTIEPKNTAATKKIIECNNLIKKHLTKEKKLYANMFEKFAQEDKQVRD